MRTALVSLLAASAMGCSCDPPPARRVVDRPPAEETCDPNVDPCEPGCPVDCSVCPADASCGICLADPARSCKRPNDCGSPERFWCEDPCCSMRCQVAADCGVPEGCPEPGSCVCVDGRCEPWTCSFDGDCPADRWCHLGQCVHPAAPADAVACRIEPPVLVLREDTSAPIELLVEDASGVPVAGAPDTLRARAPDVADVLDGRLVTGGSAPGSTSLRATIGAASCEAEIWNLPALPPGRRRIVVVDEQTGRPARNVRIRFEPGAGVDATDDLGSVTFDSDPTTVDFLPPPSGVPSFDALTVVGHLGDDVIVPIRPRDPPHRTVAIVGSLDLGEIELSAAWKLGLGGASLLPSPSSLRAGRLVGKPGSVDMFYGSEIPLSGGFVLEFGTVWFRKEFLAYAEPARRSPSTLGARDVWALGGGVPQRAAWYGGGWPDAALDPALAVNRRWQVGLVRDVDLGFGVADPEGFAPDLARLPHVDVPLVRPAALRTRLRIPRLPEPYAQASGVLAFVASPGVNGWIPLGVRSTSRFERRGLVSEEGELVGWLPVDHASAWGGAAGRGYLLAAMAIAPSALERRPVCAPDDRSGCARESVVLRWAEALPFGSDVGLPEPFLPFEDGASFDRTALRLERPPAEPGATIRILELQFADGRRWRIVAPADRSFELTAPDGSSDEAPREVLQQLLRLRVPPREAFAYGAAPWVRLLRGTEAIVTSELP